MLRHLQRAQLLMQQSRHEEAAIELRQGLAIEPNDAILHSLLAICLVRMQQFDAATTEARQGIHLAPDLAFAHYAYALVLDQRNYLKDAEAAINQAITLEPENADYLGVLSAILFQQRNWRGALEAAERGLEINPEDADCTNFRAMALVKLGRKELASSTIDAALAKDPENALSHANQGWTLLEKGQPEKAMEHFREALRLNPQMDWARQGIVEALKARHFIYRIMLSYFLWMAKLSGKAQWAFILGLYFGNRILRGVAKANPELAPFIDPLLYAYIVFVVLTWTADPLFNLMLRLNRFGRLALSREQIVASNWVGLCALPAVGAFLLWVVTQQTLLLPVALVFGLLVLPVSGIFRCSSGWPRIAMAAGTGVLALAGLAAIGFLVLSDFASGESAEAASGMFILCLSAFGIGIFLSTFAVNILAGITPKR